jgi:predicted membrane channel-forming protein YqfA (hemolysin III family)
VEIVLTRPVIIGLAIAGALFATAASVLQARGKVSPERARQLNLTGYVLMGLSMALFVVIGLRGAPT